MGFVCQVFKIPWITMFSADILLITTQYSVKHNWHLKIWMRQCTWEKKPTNFCQNGPLNNCPSVSIPASVLHMFFPSIKIYIQQGKDNTIKNESENKPLKKLSHLIKLFPFLFKKTTRYYDVMFDNRQIRFVHISM